MSISMDTIMECMNKPYKLQVIQIVQQKGKCTSSELMEAIRDIPQATMYRILDDLVKKEILVVCEEIKVRAVMKKVYTMSNEWIQFQNSIITENNGAAYCNAFMSFILNLADEFKDYAKRSDINIVQDGSGFGACTIYATRDELNQVGDEINQIIKKYQVKKTDTDQKQNQYTFATILTPPHQGQ